MNNLKVLAVRSAAPLTCVWVSTGDSRAPLAVRWVTGNVHRKTSSLATSSTEGRRCA